jgi:adenylate cyclase
MPAGFNATPFEEQPSMADLIAQGPQPQQRRRRTLVPGQVVVVGRNTQHGFDAEWDEHISRLHAEVRLDDGRLHVRRLPSGRNPIFVAGNEAQEFTLLPDEHFVIGETTFTLLTHSFRIEANAPPPIEEQTFSAEFLRQVAYRNADQRLAVLGNLPEVIRGATTDEELYVRLVNLLLAGIPRAGVVAIVALERDAAGLQQPNVLHWDRRLHTGGHFQPSRQLIVEAIRRGQSVLHVWNARAGAASFTMSDDADWAFCTPIADDSGRASALYVAGRYAQPGIAATPPTDPTDLREDVKFGELAAAILGALRRSEQLRKRQATLSRFFAPAVMTAMQATDPAAVLEPREADVCVLFCDLRGFTRTAQRNADDLMGLLQRVSRALGVMTHHILDQGGVLGDFHGDAAMGFWGWPLRQDDAIARACRTALAIRREFEAAARQPEHPLADFRVGIGLAAGRAVAGGIGTSDQVKVTVFGPVVNLASRLEGMTKLLHAPILLDETVAEFVRSNLSTTAARCRRVARVRPYGCDAALEVSELLPSAEEYPSLSDANLRDYEQALDQFIAGKWFEALELLHCVPAKDRVKDFLTVFIAQQGRVPPRDWDGVVALTTK